MLEAAVMCLAMNMYHEARSDGIRAMMAVAEVTMNRVKSDKFPNNVCDVVKHNKYQDTLHKCQFSWYCDGKSDIMYNEHWRDNAIELAVDYMTGLETDFTDGATHYHATYVNPSWNKSFTKTITIGSHIFYK